MYPLVNIILLTPDTLTTSVSNEPINSQTLIMVSALILVTGLIIWNRFPLIEVLYSYGDFMTEEKVWFDVAMKRIHE